MADLTALEVLSGLNSMKTIVEVTPGKCSFAAYFERKLRGKPRSLYKFINQLKILSMLRNLRAETVKQVRNMIITPDIVRQIEESEEFQLGVERGMEKGIVQGIEKGIERGIERGIEEGELLKAITAIRKMLQKNFAVPVIADLLEVSEDFVLDMQQQLKMEPEIITLLAKPRSSVQSVARRLKVSPLLVQVIQEASAAT